MRCPYCGSKMIYPDSKHKTFSAGKAVAGAVALGAVGAAAGFIGKDKPGYRCSACGAFTERAMDIMADSAINKAVQDAENGNFAVYNELRKKYPNIESVFQNTATETVSYNDSEGFSDESIEITDHSIDKTISVKNSYYPGVFTKDCPVYVEKVFIKATKNNDVLSLFAWNVSEKTLRSVYFKIRILDDVGDEISTCSCVYQALSVAPGDKLPTDKEFDLKTDLAYKMEFEIEKAAFDDDSVWRKNENSTDFTLSKQSEILPENFPKYKYFRAIIKENSNLSDKSKLFQPFFEKEYTQCVCGLPFGKGHPCPRCGISEESLANAVSYEGLLAYRNKSIKKLALSRSKETEKLLNTARTEEYKKAIELQNDDITESIDESISIFKRLGDFKDSKEQIQISKNNKKVLEEKITAKRIADEKAAEEKRIAQEKEAEQKRIEQERIAEEKKIADAKAAKKRKIRIAITTSFILACIAFFVVLDTVIMPNSKYNNAIESINNGKYIEAYEILTELKDYKDSKAKAKGIYVKYKIEKLKTANVGDYVVFGTCEQDNDKSNGREEIEWQALAKEGTKMLFISRYALDCQKYNNSGEDTTWENCSLRKWLNRIFINYAFSDEEKNVIKNTRINADRHPQYDTLPGNSTNDKLFILSLSEANKYFDSDYARECRGTEYCYAQGAAEESGYCGWWLRTPGKNSQSASIVYFYGTTNYIANVNAPDAAVRPAMWISLE